jgi:hypothetical protein
MKEDPRFTSGIGDWNNVGESAIEHRNMSNKSGVKNVVQLLLLSYREFGKTTNPGAIRRPRVWHD